MLDLICTVKFMDTRCLVHAVLHVAGLEQKTWKAHILCLQAALFLVEIYPAYTDTLALANIVEWLRLGRTGPAQEAVKLDGIAPKEDKSDASDQCSLDRSDS